MLGEDVCIHIVAWSFINIFRQCWWIYFWFLSCSNNFLLYCLLWVGFHSYFCMSTLLCKEVSRSIHFCCTWRKPLTCDKTNRKPGNVLRKYTVPKLMYQKTAFCDLIIKVLFITFWSIRVHLCILFSLEIIFSEWTCST